MQPTNQDGVEGFEGEDRQDVDPERAVGAGLHDASSRTSKTATVK